MSNKERKEFIEKLAEKFTEMDEADKALIVGYQLGKQEERQRWEKKQAEAATA